jgi:predicted dehydrogenase
MNSEMRKVKTAVVGVGHLGRHHLKWFSQLGNSELVGCHDIDRDKATRYAAQYDIAAFASVEEVAGNAEAVSVVVPTTAHYEVASALVERGVHCLVEKPITADLDEARRLGRLVEDVGVKFTVGQIERFNPAVTALRQYDMRPSFIEAHRLAAFDPRGTDVAVVFDLMIHDIDLVLSFIESKISDIQASAVAVISEQVDIANARLTFQNGAVANLTASRISLNAMRKLRIFQQSGYFSLDLARRQADVYRLVVSENEPNGRHIPLGKSGRELVYRKEGDGEQDMLAAELDAFLQAIIHDRPVRVSVDEATEALRVAVEVERIGRESISRMVEA